MHKRIRKRSGRCTHDLKLSIDHKYRPVAWTIWVGVETYSLSTCWYHFGWHVGNQPGGWWRTNVEL